MAFDWNTVVSAASGFVGALVGGWCTLRATEALNKHSDAKQADAEEATIKGFYQAVYAEIDALWTRYYETTGRPLENSPQHSAFEFYYPVYHDYFTVYTSNAHLIGKIADPDLRHAIVKSYTLARGMLDKLPLQ
jgi:hypothetical protein